MDLLEHDMEPFPIKTNQAALGAEGFPGLAVPCPPWPWRSLVSLPRCASACASPGHELLGPTGWCLMALSWQDLRQKLLAAQLEAGAADWYHHCFPDTAGCDG